MLATLLPGVRELRTPLAVGYVLFISAWLVFAKALPKPSDADGVLASIYQLAAAVGPAATLGSVSFAAYLVGSALLVSRSPGWALAWLGSELEILTSHGRTITITAAQLRGRTEEPGLIALIGGLPRELRDMDEQMRAEEIAESLEQRIDRETRDASRRLQVKSPPLYDAYDRLMTEAELRLSLLGPLTVLCIVLAVEWHPLALLAVVIPGTLAIQGVRKEVQARLLMNQAFRDRLVQSATMEGLAAWLEREPLPSRIQP